MVTRFPPAEKGRQEDQAGVEPDQNNANPQATRSDQLIVGQRLGYCKIAIHTDASQTSHGNTFQNGNDISKNLASQRLVDTCGVVEK